MTAPSEDPPAVEEVVASEEAAAVENTGPSTKLYFGNLPYLCDSAQLAGIIQQYASPELVEVYCFLFIYFYSFEIVYVENGRFCFCVVNAYRLFVWHSF